MFLDFNFILRALLAGMGIALISGPLGAVIVWRRMANFGDTLAHATLLGVCLALLLNINMYLGLLAVCIFIAAILAMFSQQRQLASDTILSMIAYTTLALGLITATLIQGVRVDLLGYLYGDILSVNQNDLLWIYSMVVLVLCLVFKIWNSLLSVVVHEDLAQVEGVSVKTIKWIFIIILAIVFAISMKLVGILLITALLIIPASAARQIAKTPEQMVFLASLLGMVAVAGGIIISFYWDWPAGPSIVVAAFLLFLTTHSLSHIIGEG